MRLLQLEDNGTVSITKDTPDATTRYAILSHTWGGDKEEVTFEGIQNLSADDKRNRILAKAGYNKILFCGWQAKQCGISLTFEIDSAEAEHFVGREFELNQIHSLFRPSVGRRTGIIHGLGGMAQLAIAYAKRYRDNYSTIHWFNARDDAALR
ncbi:hypothetical protein PWT90_05362 [Aphanocladium album]|nr:hypothetical protein PWT90_05362 [Aphanocladium album]